MITMDPIPLNLPRNLVVRFGPAVLTRLKKSHGQISCPHLVGTLVTEVLVCGRQAHLCMITITSSTYASSKGDVISSIHASTRAGTKKETCRQRTMSKKKTGPSTCFEQRGTPRDDEDSDLRSCKRMWCESCISSAIAEDGWKERTFEMQGMFP